MTLSKHRSYRRQVRQEQRKRRDAELTEAERAYAIERTRGKGRDDLTRMLEAGTISAGEAFFRLHARR
jgi:hypothetical protein